jgi:LPXTG-site transpeptidase (sortase) family protein
MFSSKNNNSNYNSKYSKVLTMLLIILVVAILGIAGYFGYDMLSASAVNKNAESAIEKFEEVNNKKIVVEKKDTNTTVDYSNMVVPTYENTTTTPAEEVSQEQTTTEQTSNAKAKTEKTYMEGYEVLGTIYIPKTKCKYPILGQVTKKSLETAVAVLYPTNAELNVDSNVVIVGHNYRNNLFFSNNYKLSNGDRVEITSSEEKVTYIIYDMFYTTPDDANYMQREIPEGVREISLSTCNDDSSQRLIILAREQGK